MMKRLRFLVALLGLMAVAHFVVADGTLQSVRWTNALVRDGAVPDSPAYGLMLGGYDGANFQFLAVGADGAMNTELPAAAALADDTTNPTAPAVGAFLLGWDGTTWDLADIVDTGALVIEACDSGSGSALCADVQTVGSDSLANTENGLTTAGMTYVFNATTGAWVRARGVPTDADDVGTSSSGGVVATGAELFAFDGTAFDRIRSLASNANDQTPQAVGALHTFSALAGYHLSDANLDIINSFHTNANDLAQSTEGVALETMAHLTVYDEDETNWDLVFGYDTDGDNVATEAEGVTLATTSFPMVYDLTGTNFDRMSTGMVLGAGVPGTATVLGVDSTSSCASALSLGYYRVTPVAVTEAVAYCCRAATSCTATTSDTPYLDGQYYYEAVTDAAANDVICCIAASGTNSVNLFATPLTF